MNSVLQLIFHIPDLRNLILQTDGGGAVLKELKKLLMGMAMYEQIHHQCDDWLPSTRDLIKAFDWG
jgi:hypothetical protein